MEYARQWADAKGLELDETLSLRDEGLSAYHQKHVTQGALGTFLLAVDEGRIPIGSVLVVEGLDRLSRAEPILAQAQLAQIINAGITVVTASDGREYNRDKLKVQPMDLVYSLLVMIRAHEESDTKSKRVKASIRKLCASWQAGTYRGLIRNGTDPSWLRLNGTTWELIPERVEAVRATIQLFMEGHGAVSIVRILTDRGLSISEGSTAASQIYRLIRLRALVGEKNLMLDRETYSLNDYYPALMDEDAFAELQAQADTRGRRKGKGEIPGVITGLGLSICGYCGTAMLGQNLMARRKEDGSMNPGHRRLICVGYSHSNACDTGGSCSVVPVERAVMRYCSDQMNLLALMDGGSRMKEWRAVLVKHRKDQTTLEQQLERVTAALMADTGDAPLAFVKKARELEEQLTIKAQEIKAVERELSAQIDTRKPALADAWEKLAQGVDELDYESRMKARQLVANTFQRIVIYHKGIAADQGRGGNIDVMLISKSGQSRLLRIDRATGDWIAMETAELV